VSDPSIDPYKAPPEEGKRINWWFIGLGMLIFGVGDFFYFFAAVDRPGGRGALILIGITLGVAALFFAAQRSISLGIVAGYVVMTITSAGECTLLFEDPLAEGGGAFGALILYPIALIVVGIVAIVVTVSNRRGGE
jgi:hypothetical protein